MTDITQITQFVLRLIMVVLFTVGLGVLLSPKYYSKAFERMFENRAMTYGGAIVALVVGFGIISYHNVWRGPEVLITLFGWLAFVKGVVVLVLPEHFMRLSNHLINHKHFYAYGIAAIILGFLFGYFGYLF